MFSPTTSVNSAVPGATPFALTDVLEFTFTLDPGSGQVSANVSASSVVTDAPAPSALVMTAVGLATLVAVLARRRLLAA